MCDVRRYLVANERLSSVQSCYNKTFPFRKIKCYRREVKGKKVKVEFGNRPGVPQRFPEGLGSQITMTFGT